MNYNESLGSQRTPKGYTDRLNPEFMESVINDGKKGNFISLISRGFDDNDMVDRFEMQWKKNSPQRPANSTKQNHENEREFKMHRMQLLDGKPGKGFEGGRFPSKGVMKNNTDFLRSDHAAFWYSNHRDYYASLKAVHVSDTGNVSITISICH